VWVLKCYLSADFVVNDIEALSGMVLKQLVLRCCVEYKVQIDYCLLGQRSRYTEIVVMSVAFVAVAFLCYMSVIDLCVNYLIVDSFEVFAVQSVVYNMMEMPA